MTYTQISLLAEFLEDHGISEKTEIRFREKENPDAPNDAMLLSVECEDEELAGILAKFFGCPEADLTGEAEFDADPDWHGNGEGNLKELADELGHIYGEEFDIPLSVKRILKIADS